MAEPAAPPPADFDPDFEPFSRPRSCTWPLPRPELLHPPGGSSTSSPAPSVQPEPGGNVDFISSLLEESENFPEEEEEDDDDGVEEKPSFSRCMPTHPTPAQPLPMPATPAPLAAGSSSTGLGTQRKSGSSRRNAWGNMSYADLITKAIESSQEKRLTLSQIYDWMVRTVPYFMDKGDSNSSAGWKNSIRHNLSLHSRFVRVQNEGTGKSSWWMLNPEGGKSGKSPRRRAASMDNNSKFSKSRGRAAKKKVSLQGGPDGGADSPGSQFPKWAGSPNSHSNDDFESWTAFRPRASSDASTLSGRLSPFIPEQDDLGDRDMHLGYPVSSGAKMAGTLPSLSEVSSTMGHHGPENVMESLLDNLNLLSPKNSQVAAGGGSSQTSPSPMMQTSPGYPTFSSPNMAPPPDYRKCLYAQPDVTSLSSMSMHTLPESKALSQYNCPAGLLKELLTSDSEMPSVDTVVTQSGSGRGRLHPYNTGKPGHVGKMMGPIGSHPHPHVVHNQAPPASVVLNGRPLLHHVQGPAHLPIDKSPLQAPFCPPPLMPPPSYCSLNGNGYGRPSLAQLHMPEKLPSDLDGMSIERFECDMESVLRDALMDGDSFDFNFDPSLSSQGFPHGVKTTTHSWVSG